MQLNQELWTLGVCLVEEELWFTSVEFNGMFRADMNTGKIEFVSQIDGFDRKQKFGFSCIIKIENSLYLCPFYANSICRYDLQNNKTQIYPLELEMAPCVNRADCFGDKIYMFSDSLHLIIAFNIKNGKITYFNENSNWKYNFDKACDIVCLEESFYFVEGCKIIRTDLWFKKIADYDISEYSGGEDIMTIAFYKENFWMLCGKERLISWNKMSGEICCYPVPELGNAYRSIISGKNLYILYPDTNHILIADMENKAVSGICRRQLCSQDGMRKVFLPFLKKGEKGLFAYSFIHSCINYIQPSGEVERVPLYMEHIKEFLLDYMRFDCYTENLVFYEGEKYLESLNFFLKCIGSKCEERQFENTHIGRTVHKKMKESMGNIYDFI